MKKCFIITFTLIMIRFVYPANSQFEIKLGYGGYTVPGYWTPLIIKNSQEIYNGSIEIERITSKKDSPKEIFPVGKNSIIECPVLIDEFTESIIVRLFSGNELLLERTVNTDDKVFPGHIILTSGMSSRIQQSLTQCLFPVEPVMTVSIDNGDFPSTALNYDCISALVMVDPGNRLTPAQINALKYWISCGGKLVLFRLLPPNESILDKFEFDRDLFDNKSTIDLGYGKIFAFYQEAGEMKFTQNSAAWHDLLEMKPYAHNLRLTSSKTFLPDDNPYRKMIDDSFLRMPIFIILLIWSGFFILLLLIVKKKILILSLYTLGAIIFLIPAGFVLQKMWHGGANYQNRMIVLPGNSGVSVDTKIWFPRNSGRLDIGNNYSIWGINALFDVSEKSYINGWSGKRSSLIHSLVKPVYSLKTGNTGSIEISSFLSNEILEGHFIKQLVVKNKGSFIDINKVNFGNNPNLVLVKGSSLDIEWWIWDEMNFKWIRKDAIPEWLSNDTGWISQLKRLKPLDNWLIGRDKMPGMNLKIQNDLCSLTLWAIPVK